MQSRNTFPLALIFGGTGAALYFAAAYVADLWASTPNPDEYAVAFAFFSFIAVIGWVELKSDET